MEDTQTKILEFLSECEGEEVPTLKISKHVFGEKATKKMINRHLYALQKECHVRKTCEENGSKPKWSIEEQK